MNKVRVWSSFIEGSEGESDKSDLENATSVSELRRIQLLYGIKL